MSFSFSLLPSQNPPETGLECGICFEAMINPIVVLHCGTMFCRRCWLKWTKDHVECPHCRTTEIAIAEAPRFVKEKLYTIKVKCDACSMEMRQEEMKQHATCCQEAVIRCSNKVPAFSFAHDALQLKTPSMSCSAAFKRKNAALHDCPTKRLMSAHTNALLSLMNATLNYYIDPEKIDGIHWISAVLLSANYETRELSYMDPFTKEMKDVMLNNSEGRWGSYFSLDNGKLKEKYAIRI